MNRFSALRLPAAADGWNLQPAVLMAVKTASDLSIFTVLSDRTTPYSWKELAAPKNADIQLVGRLSHQLESTCCAS